MSCVNDFFIDMKVCALGEITSAGPGHVAQVDLQRIVSVSVALLNCMSKITVQYMLEKQNVS